MRRARPLLLLLFAPGLLGMGVFGGNQSPKVPGNLKDAVTADFEDAAGARLRVEKVNIGGEEHLRGKLGRGLVLIPFAKIRALSFSGTGDRMREAEAELADGRRVTLEVKADTEFSGASEFGAYYVQVRDLKSIRFDLPPGAGAEGGQAPSPAAAAEDAPRIPGL